MRLGLAAALVLACAMPVAAQTLKSSSTLVVVPALVQDAAGEPVFTLEAKDFALTDDGVAQKLTLERDTGGEPLTLVVDLEVGGAGTREFLKVTKLAAMLEGMVGDVPHTIAVVGFDSEPALVQPFTPDTDAVSEAILKLTPGCSREHHLDNCASPTARHDESLGDNGAAILDSLAFSVELLRKQPVRYRRAILLISESLDRGSKIRLEDAVRDLSDTNTAIYSIGFSTGRSEAAHYAHRNLPTQSQTYGPMTKNILQPGGFTFFALANHIPNPPNGCMGKDPDADPDKSTKKVSQAYDCAGQWMPPLLFARMAAIAVVDGLQKNVPQTVAHLTGGEYFKLTDAKSLERSLQAIANHMPNRYILSFQPQDPEAGLHDVRLTLPEHAGLTVTARPTYWAGPSAFSAP